ncbi:MAG TPA: hypothetical protein VD866_23185 [Urbifossiella sp.]|nr:hypothetical protein [Urbifossiella sp.]
MGATVGTQAIQFGFDTDAVWDRIRGRRSVFLDSNGWIDLADGKKETPVRVRESLRAQVAAGRVFCPLSWGTVEELLDQSGPSLPRTAALMEELSLNAVFLQREELFAWELTRAMRRFFGGQPEDSLNGLFVPPAAFVGSALGISIELPDGVSIGHEAQAHARAFMKRELSSIGIASLAQDLGGSKMARSSPAYSMAAKRAKELFKGNKAKLFVEEAGDCFRLYVTPVLMRCPPDVMMAWLAQFSGAGEEPWFRRVLAELPALYNHVDVMVVASSQPDRKDRPNHFMDNAIMTAPLAYADVFVSADRAVKDIAGSRTRILDRSSCRYCASLAELETWLGTIS